MLLDGPMRRQLTHLSSDFISPPRHRDSMSRKLRAMRDARERRRLESSEPPYLRELPSLRRTLIIIDHDFGTVEHRIDLYRTQRI